MTKLQFKDDKYDYEAVIAEELANMSEEELWKLYESNLQKHDWYFQHARANSNPSKHKEDSLRKVRIDQLNTRLRLLDPNRADRMYADACPWGMA